MQDDKEPSVIGRSSTQKLQRADTRLKETLPPLPLNAILILAGTLHGIHAITGKLDPTTGTGSGNQASGGQGKGQGLEAFEAEGWGGRVYVTPTGQLRVLDRIFIVAPKRRRSGRGNDFGTRQKWGYGSDH